MINIEVKANKKDLKIMTYSNEVSIKDLIKEIDDLSSKAVTYLINNQYVHGNTIISKDSVVEAVFLDCPQGMKIYQDFLIFLLNMAIFKLYGAEKVLSIEHSIGDGIYCEFFDEYIDDDMLESIKLEMKNLISQQIPIEKITLPVDQAYEIAELMNRKDIIKNLDFHNKRFFEIYKAGEYYDYYPRPLSPHTGCADEYDIIKAHNGFILRLPSTQTGKLSLDYAIPRLLFSQHQEHDKWLKILNVETVGDLNQLIYKNKIRDFILTEEALHEKKIATIADYVKMRKTAKIVLIAGPSSSGKTTFAKRLAVQLKVNGYEPFVLGLDDYFLPRTRTPRLENGEYDFESIHSIDLELLNKDLTAILQGEEVNIPKYNFIIGDREKSNHFLKLGTDNILIIEGIHGLNEELTFSIPIEKKVKIYISALNQLNIDYHNRIPTTDCRRIRRIVRDAQYRGYSAEETLLRWASVREGEDKNIFPFQEDADFMFNSSLTFEIGVLKKHIMPMLRSISYKSPVYNEAQNLIYLADHFLDIKDEFVPCNSILREFLSGSIFEK
ncbi:MAG: nucleoside kinase [Candidatus Cloacimonetes bacterium]|nr:nucleoside kinase [Candidatus Cloacimonadota bacterium]